MHKILSFFFIITFAILVGNLDSFAQCCSAGNPISTDGSSCSIGKNAINVTFMYKNSTSDTYFHGSESTDLVYKESFFHFTSLNIEYGLTDKLSLAWNSGYFIRKSEVYPNVDYQKYANGLGDGGLTLKYNFLNLPKYKSSSSILATVKFPMGAKNVEFDGVILPIDFQPSTGSLRYNIAFSTSLIISPKVSLFSFLSYEYIDEIETESATYKYGDIFVESLGLTYKVQDNLSFVVQGRYEWRGKRVDNEDEIRGSTGGKIFYIVPQVNYSLKNGMGFSVSYDQPLYRYMNFIPEGTGQLGNKRMITFKVSSSINQLFQPRKFTVAELELLNEKQLFVDGICGMCKERIERIALKVKNVKSAVWDDESKQLIVKYSNSFDVDKLMKQLAKAGHDTKNFKATEKAYANLHECCKYRITSY